MKWTVLIGFLFISTGLFSCESNPSTVCDEVEPDKICMDYKTSDLVFQTWKQTGNYYRIHLTNDPGENPYLSQLDIYFRLFDHVSDSIPQTGSYKAASSINTGLTTKQFDVDLYIDGKQDYELDLSNTSTFEIELINNMVIDGKAFCYFKHYSNSSDKKQLNLNFQGATIE